MSRKKKYEGKYEEGDDENILRQWIKQSEFATNLEHRSLLIGSRAMHYFTPIHPDRQAHSDYDFIVSPKTYLDLMKPEHMVLFKFFIFYYDPHYVLSSNRPRKPQQQQQQPLPQKPTTQPSTATSTTATTPTSKHKNDTNLIVIVAKVQLGCRASGMRFEFEIPLRGVSSALKALTDLYSEKTSTMMVWKPPAICQLLDGDKFVAQVAPPPVLERIKKSHIYWPAHFSKTIDDLHTLRPKCGQIGLSEAFNSLLHTFYMSRLAETEQRNGISASHIHMNQTNEDFLDKQDNLTLRKIIPHDDIHELVKFGDVPKFTKIKKDQSKAACDQKLFEALPLSERIEDVQEEGMVLTLERYLLLGRLQDSKEAYRRALERICTTITKGWFREFAIDHYPAIVQLPPSKDLAVLRDRILAGKIEREAKEAIWPEWFTAEELVHLTTIRKSWHVPEELSGPYRYLHPSTLLDGFFYWNRSKYQLTICSQSDSHPNDCQYYEIANYKFEIRKCCSATISVKMVEWNIESTTTRGAYDSNRDEYTRQLDTFELTNSFCEPSNDTKTSHYACTLKQLAKFTKNYFPSKDLLKMILSYTELPKLFQDNHFLVRFMLAQWLYTHHETHATHLPWDLEQCLISGCGSSSKLAWERELLRLSDKQRRHPFYEYFLCSRYYVRDKFDDASQIIFVV